MFEAVQEIVWRAGSVEDGLRQTVAFARENGKVFSPRKFWDAVESGLPELSIHTIVDWAQEGWEGLEPRSGWELLFLDLGDCPESFALYSPGGQALLDENQVRRWLCAGPVLGCTDLENCFSVSPENPFRELFGEGREFLVEHHVSELDDPLLDWTRWRSESFHGDSGYLLWLAVGSLAAVESLRDPEYCRCILNGRERLYLLSGFEEIFLVVGTVTPDGLRFPQRMPRTPGPGA